MALKKQEVSKIVEKFGKEKKDTGSIEVQIALLTKRIENLTEHLKNHHKDSTSRRGLLVLVGKRKSLLNYLERTNRDSYIKLLSELGLRK